MVYVPGNFDAAHWYLQWGGLLPGNEQWSCGMRLAADVGVVVGPPTAGQMTAAVAAVQAFHTNALSGISSRALLSFVKLNPISEDGHYMQDVTTQTVLANIAGGSVAADVPNQITLAVSLTTGYSRGPAHRGRFYIPQPVWPVSYDGLISAVNADKTSDATDIFVAALDAVSGDYFPAVFSRKSGAAAHRAITGNKVGRVLDTQRRRRRSLVEDYQ